MKKGAFIRFLSELKRRNVYKSALAYIVAGWIILQVMAVTLPSFKLPLSIIKWTVILLILAFPFWLIFSWIYELTPNGLKKTVDVDPSESISTQTGNRFNKIILGALGIAIALLLFNAFKSTSVPTTDSVENRQLLNTGLNQNENSDNSIAVLAFADMSPKQDQEYFSDGISEEILNLLARIPDLKVISRTSSFSFKGKDATTEEIGKVLHVSHILEGSVRKSGNTLRITAQLIKVSNGAHIWSETFDRELDDIFKIQDEIAARVTRQLTSTLKDRELRSKEVDVDAYELFLRAKYENITEEGIARAETLLKQSIAIDSNYAPSWRQLAIVQLSTGTNFPIRSVSEAIQLARTSVQRAIELNPEYAEAYSTLSRIQMSDWEFSKAQQSMNKALQLEPGNNRFKTYASLRSFSSKGETVALVREEILLDPLDYGNYFSLATYLYENKQYKEAGEALEVYETYFPKSATVHNFRTMILLAQGKTLEALEEAEKEQDAFWKLHALNFAMYAVGREKEADSLLSEIIRRYGERGGEVNIAEIYAFRGEEDEAFKWLEKAWERKDPTLVGGIYWPNFQILYQDPRWAALIEKMGLPKGHEVPTGKI